MIDDILTITKTLPYRKNPCDKCLVKVTCTKSQRINCEPYTKHIWYKTTIADIKAVAVIGSLFIFAIIGFAMTCITILNLAMTIINKFN